MCIRDRYDLTLELYENTGAEFNTGIPVIDGTYGNDRGAAGGETGGFGASDEVLDNQALTTEDGFTVLDERDSWFLTYDFDDRPDLSQNVVLEDEAEVILDWSETNPFSESGKY